MDLKDALKDGRAERFLDELSLSVRKIIFSSFPNLTEDEKEEIDQDVKLKILKMAANGKKIGNFRSYVWKMVYSTALDALKARGRDLSLEDVTASGADRTPFLSFLDTLTPDAVYEEGECRALLEGALTKLPIRRKAVVSLHFQGLGLEEIAAFLGQSLPAVRHLLYRGLEELKERLAPVLLSAGRDLPRPAAIVAPAALAVPSSATAKGRASDKTRSRRLLGAKAEKELV
jgi:RNA polymerase sigma-70 factor (ECF subfamily)